MPDTHPTAGAPTWIVLTRDVSASVRIAEQPVVMATLVLDADTGLVRGISVGDSAGASRRDAMDMALSRPAASLPPAPPCRVVHAPSDGDGVRAALQALSPRAGDPELFAAGPIPEAEDIFDSFLGRMSGRDQPADLPQPQHWEAFYAAAQRFCRLEPWLRRSDAELLALRLPFGGARRQYVVSVLGQAGIQRGLGVYPGRSLPASAMHWEPDSPPPYPRGSMVCWLDPIEDTPRDWAAKALRYGWPDELDLFPVPLSLDVDGIADLGIDRLGALTAALDAVCDRDEQAGQTS